MTEVSYELRLSVCNRRAVPVIDGRETRRTFSVVAFFPLAGLLINRSVAVVACNTASTLCLKLRLRARRAC